MGVNKVELDSVNTGYVKLDKYSIRWENYSSVREKTSASAITLRLQNRFHGKSQHDAGSRQDFAPFYRQGGLAIGVAGRSRDPIEGAPYS